MVTLEKDIREDDIENTINAIKMIKGVVGVNSIKTKHDDLIIENRIKRQLREKLYEWGKNNL